MKYTKTKIVENDIITFIKFNGWEEETEANSDYRSFYKERNYGIDINNTEVVFIGENGDFAHFKISCDTIYTIIGFMLEIHAIGIDYCRYRSMLR